VLRALDVATGTSWQIANAVDGDNHEWSGAQWAPDGSFIAMARSGWSGEYKLFQGVTYDAVTKLVQAAARTSGR
jgi:hypothetical protein